MGSNTNMNAVQRYLYPAGSKISVNSNGLLIGSSGSIWQKNLIGTEIAAGLPGGILIAEGGMGKTTFMEQFRYSIRDRSVHLFKLGEYVGDPGALSNDVKVFLTASSPCKPKTILFDGLDEAPKLAGAVLRSIRQLSDSTRFWLASRDISAIRAITEERQDLKSYSMAPLSETDVQTLAVQAAVDADQFMHAASRQGILPICAKPLGCELALSVFRENGLIGVAQRDLWQRGIERLCDETPSPTRHLLGASKFTLDEIIGCSAWISMCLALSDNHFVWSGEQSHRPQQSLGISELSSDSFSGDLIRATLERGVFSPLGDGRVAFSHAMYRDYLAAFGFAAFIPAEHWIPLLMNGQRDAVFLQRRGISAWLATYNAGFLDKLSAIQPELLLASVDSVQAIGPDRLCAALLDRADSLSYRQRQSEPVSSNLLRLRDGRTPEVLRTCLLDPGSGDAAIELATAVVEACEYSELAGVLADRVLHVGLSLRQRVAAAYAVCRLQNDAAKKQLKQLLPINPSEDPEDNLRGTALRACWPTHLATDDMVVHLKAPQKPNHFGAYGSFLESYLPASLEASLDESSAVVLLNWALPHINEHDHYVSLGRLARGIYTICWKFTGTPAVAELLAVGYVKSSSKHRSAFLQKRYDGECMPSHVLTRESFLNDVDGRFAVLTIILSRSDLDSRKWVHVPFTDYPLYTQDDLPVLFERVNSDPSGPLAEQWAVCIKSVLLLAGHDAYADQVDCLHAVRPDLIDDYRKLHADITAAAKRAAKFDKKWKKDEEDRQKECFDDQERIDSEIKEALHTPGLKPGIFAALSSWLNSQNGVRSLGSIDIQRSPGWAKLTEEEQGAMLDLARRYLTEAEILPTAPNHHQYGVACAFNALRLLRPSVYAGLSREVWRKCSVELLKAAMHDNLELLAPLFDTLSEHFPDVATEAVLAVLSQELQREFISIIRNWGDRLSDAQAEAIVAIADAPATDPCRCFLLLSELARHGKESLVRAHLESVFSVGWNVPPDSALHKLRRLVFELSPSRYIRQLLDALAADPDWGRQWLESAIGGHDNYILGALLTCDMSEVAEMYIWLHDQYPPETCPEHVDAYTPGPLDEIHTLKTHLINHLIESGKDGSTAALQTVAINFPSETWLASCVLDAKTAELANTAPVLPIAQIKKLCAQRSASRCLVNSVQDLLDVTMASLEAYHTYLQGDTCAIGDLWNTEPPIRPRDEECLSDHLKRYLDLILKTNVVINREVQIRRKLFKDGASGSRTDIWVQATDESGDVLTLCIEIKCNWNKSSKNALKDQLIAKYMSGDIATAGILLLGWFACDSWDSNDYRLARSTATWSDSAAAMADLHVQADIEQKAGNNVKAIVLDCGLK